MNIHAALVVLVKRPLERQGAILKAAGDGVALAAAIDFKVVASASEADAFVQFRAVGADRSTPSFDVGGAT
jgi:hypothetical protein